MSKGRKSDFESIEGEEIIRVRNENQAKREKMKFNTKKIQKDKKCKRKAKWRKKWEEYSMRFKKIVKKQEQN